MKDYEASFRRTKHKQQVAGSHYPDVDAREMAASVVPRWLRLCVASATLAAIFPAVYVPAYMFIRWGSLVPRADIVYPILLSGGTAAVTLASVAAVGLHQRSRLTLAMGAATAFAWFALFLAASVALKDRDHISFIALFIVVLPSFGCFLIAGCIMALEFFAKRDPIRAIFGPPPNRTR